MTKQPNKHYLAIPKSGKGPGVLALHAWWGLNDFFKSFCDRLAAEGFVVLAPDLFQGKVAKTIDEADQLSSAMPMEKVEVFLTQAADDLSQHPSVNGSGLGVVGFSYGAFWALWLSKAKADLFRAVTVFYGTGADDFSSSKSAYQGHFAENDPFEPLENVTELEGLLKAANRTVDFNVYPGTGHWFFEEDRMDAFDPQAAELAWERTVRFLRTQLDRSS